MIRTCTSCNKKIKNNNKTGLCVGCYDKIQRPILARLNRQRNPDNFRSRENKWREANLEKAKQQSRTQWKNNSTKYNIKQRCTRSSNLEKFREREKKYYHRNKEKINSRRKEIRLQNLNKFKEQERTASAKYYSKNPEKYILWNREYRQLNAEKFQLFNATRRAREKDTVSNLSLNEWEFLLELCNYCCLSCHQDKELTIDHIIPISKKGSTSLSNVQPLCQSCNSKKSIKTTDFRSEEIKKCITNFPSKS